MDKSEDSNVDSEDDFLEQAPAARTKVTGRKIKVSGGDFRGSKVGGDTINVFSSTQPGGSRQIEHLPKDTFLLTPNILVYEKDQINAESRILLGELQSDITGNQIIVIKVLNDCENARREARTHFRIPLHPNIVRPLFANTFEYRTQACIYIAMECCDVLNLYKYIKLLKKEQCPYNAPLFISFAKQIVNGVIFLHLHNVVNRDLKPQNILLTPDKTVVKICDFGLSKPVAGETTYLTKPQAGTSGWISPEVLRGEKFISVAADIYPLGLMLYHLFSYGDHAFGKDLLSLNHYIMRNMNLNLDNILVPFPDLVRELILQMLDQDPSLRPTAKQVRDRLKEIFEGTDTAVQTSLQEKGSIEVVDAADVHTVAVVKESLQKASSGDGESKLNRCTKDPYVGYDDVSSDNPLSGNPGTGSYEVPLPPPTITYKGDIKEIRSDDASYIEPKFIFGSEDKKVQGEVQEILYDETQQTLYEDSGSMDQINAEDIYEDFVDESTMKRSETVPNRINVLPVPIPPKNLSSDNIRDEGLYTDSSAVRSSQTPKPRKKTVFEFNDEAFKRGASEYRPKGWRDKSSQGGPPLPSRNTRPRPRSLLAGVDETFKWESGHPDAYENKKSYIKRTPSRRVQVPGVPASTRPTESGYLSFANPENPRGSPGKPPFSGRTQFDDNSPEYEVYEGPTTKESSYVFDRKKTGSTKREDRSVMKSMKKSLKKKFSKKTATKQCEYPIGEKAVVDIARSQIRIDNLISTHTTGDISKGIWAPPPIGGQQYDVLTKSPQGTSLDHGELLREAELMRILRHQNLLRLLGVVSQDVAGSPTVLVIEHPDYGNLYHFLKEGPGRKSLFDDQCDMAAEVASGMSFMEKQNFVHCDLHSENVFVFHAGKPVCKVGGFHYADELEDGKRICGERDCYAAKWIAPEVRSDNFFTAKSDIWSFGVLLTEIFSKGKEPYEGMSKAEAQEFVQGGYRMTRRPNWPKQLYKIMLTCWDEIPTDRPSFPQLLQSIYGL